MAKYETENHGAIIRMHFHDRQPMRVASCVAGTEGEESGPSLCPNDRTNTSKTERAFNTCKCASVQPPFICDGPPPIHGVR